MSNGRTEGFIVAGPLHPPVRRAQRIFLAFLAVGLLLASVVPTSVGQAGTGELRVETDYELIGTSELNGGGHVTWTLTEDEAQDLRRKIVSMFDEYPQIPTGFTFEGGTTSAIRNGLIDRAEALQYTAYLENELEGTQRGFTGTDVGYVRVDRADLFDAAIERSTSGLILSDANSTAPLQIKFLFNAHTTVVDAPVALPSPAFADALHDVFSFRRAQPSNLSAGIGPLLLEGGWHVVTIDGTTAFWAGNDATGRYTNNASNATRTERLIATRDGLDLRFATSARATFRYRGQVADVNDVLRFEVSLDSPSYSSWTTFRTIAPTNGSWRDETIDLNLFLGQQARFRLVFTSDASGTSEGFYVRDFAIEAPSVYDGILVEAQAHYLIGTLSLTDPVLPVGSMNVIRTPGGEILWYGATWPSAVPPSDSLRFQTFNAIENPQILFVVMLASAYFISRSQETAYDRYRDATPAIQRAALRRTTWLHLVGKVSMGLLVLLYFVPSAFFNLGFRAYVSGPAYWLLAVSLALAVGLGTRVYYELKLERPPAPSGPEAAPVPAPAPSTPVAAHCTRCLREIGKDERTFACTCGAIYHLTCASDLGRCTNCRKPLAIEVVSKTRAVAERCGTCGHSQDIPEGSDLRFLACTSCGRLLRAFPEGKGILLVASNPAAGFSVVSDFTKAGKPALVLTSAAPERLRLEYGLHGVDVVQVSSLPQKGIDPKRLDPDGLKAILPLTRSDKGGVLLIDGLEQMVNESSVAEVIRFLRKASDMAFVHKVSVVARAAPAALGTAELDRLRTEFDESIDLAVAT